MNDVLFFSVPTDQTGSRLDIKHSSGFLRHWIITHFGYGHFIFLDKLCYFCIPEDPVTPGAVPASSLRRGLYFQGFWCCCCESECHRITPGLQFPPWPARRQQRAAGRWTLAPSTWATSGTRWAAAWWLNPPRWDQTTLHYLFNICTGNVQTSVGGTFIHTLLFSYHCEDRVFAIRTWINKDFLLKKQRERNMFTSQLHQNKSTKVKWWPLSNSCLKRDV